MKVNPPEGRTNATAFTIFTSHREPEGRGNLVLLGLLRRSLPTGRQALLAMTPYLCRLYWFPGGQMLKAVIGLRNNGAG